MSEPANKPIVCFFATTPRQKLFSEQYSIMDIRILNELGYKVIIASRYSEIPYNCMFYFSWWVTGSIFPLIKAKLSRRPIIVIAGGNELMRYSDSLTGVPYGYLNMPWLKKAAVKIVIKLSDIILPVSDFMLKDQSFFGYKRQEVVHNCVDTELFKIAKGKKLNRKRLVSVINLDQDVITLKRGHILLQAIKILKDRHADFSLYIFGQKGNAYEKTLAEINSLGIAANVKLMGIRKNSQFARILPACTCYIQISDTETFGLSIAEAMSCGLPVVTSQCGAIPEIVGEHGIFVDHNHAISVANGIAQVLEMTDAQRQELGEKLRRRIVECFSYEKRKKKIENVINKILHGK